MATGDHYGLVPEPPPPPPDYQKFDGKFNRDNFTSTDPRSEEGLADAPPKVPGDSGVKGGGNIFAASIGDLKVFSANIEALIPSLKKVRAAMLLVDIKPGTFYDAVKLANKINGVNLVTPTVASLDNAIETLTDLKEKIGKMILDFNSTEELNKMTSEKLKTRLTEVTGDINANK